MRIVLAITFLSALSGCASWREQAEAKCHSITLPQSIVIAALVLGIALIWAVRTYVEGAYEEDDKE